MPDSYTFTVTTKTFNWTVRRTQEDFEWLRSTLRALFPGCIVPPTPSVKNDKLTHKRFLEAVLANDIFRASGILRAFLKEDSLSSAKEVLFPQTAKSTHLPDRAEDMWTPTGFIICDIDESSDHITWHHEYFYRDQAAKIKLAESLSTLKFHIKESAESLKASAKQLAIVDNLQNTMEGCLPFSGIYAGLGILVENWANLNLYFMGVMVKRLTGFFRAQIEELTSIAELAPVRQQWLEAYKRRPTDERAKNLYGFYNYQSKSEVDRVLKYHCRCLSLNFSDLSSELLTKLSEAEEQWADFASLLKKKCEG